MQEKNPANPTKHQEPGRQPGTTPEPRKDFPGKAPDVYSDNQRSGQNPGRSSQGNPGDSRRDDSTGKPGNAGSGSDQRRQDQSSAGQKPGTGRNPSDR